MAPFRWGLRTPAEKRQFIIRRCFEYSVIEGGGAVIPGVTPQDIVEDSLIVETTVSIDTPFGFRKYPSGRLFNRMQKGFGVSAAVPATRRRLRVFPAR